MWFSFILSFDTQTKYNIDNEQYISTREIKVLDIRQNAEQNIVFYRDQIAKKLDSKAFVHISTEKTINEVQTMFKYYQLALYLYAFSTFLDLMLLRNFQEDYLKSVQESIRKYCIEYQEYYSESYEKMKHFIETSAQAQALKGASVVTKFAGGALGKLSKVKSEKISDKLSHGSEKLAESSDKIIDFKETMNDKSMTAFLSNKESGIDAFVVNIDMINAIYNRPTEMFMDKDKIYLSKDVLEEAG